MTRRDVPWFHRDYDDHPVRDWLLILGGLALIASGLLILCAAT